MSALDAAVMQQREARAQVARRLDRAASALTRQASHVRAGRPYEASRALVELAGIEEWVDILDAHTANVIDLLEAADGGAA